MPEKIMIIEDDPIIRTELKTLLKGNGFLPCVVTDFERTVRQVKEEDPRLILLDINCLERTDSLSARRSGASPMCRSSL